MQKKRIHQMKLNLPLEIYSMHLNLFLFLYKCWDNFQQRDYAVAINNLNFQYVVFIYRMKKDINYLTCFSLIKYFCIAAADFLELQEFKNVPDFLTWCVCAHACIWAHAHMYVRGDVCLFKFSRYESTCKRFLFMKRNHFGTQVVFWIIATGS